MELQTPLANTDVRSPGLAVSPGSAIQRVKAATGIKVANCSTCARLGSDGDGPEYNGNWPICNKHDRFGYLKSFPFKKEMKCWEPDFWQSKFTDNLQTCSDREMNSRAKRFHAAVAVASQNEKLTDAAVSDSRKHK